MKKSMHVLIALFVAVAVVLPATAVPGGSGTANGVPFNELWEAIGDLQDQIDELYTAIFEDIAGLIEDLQDQVNAVESQIPTGYWYTPMTATVAGPSIGSPPDIFLIPMDPCEAIKITADDVIEDDDLNWVLIGLTVPANFQVESVKVNYKVNSAVEGRTYISQVRLAEMTGTDSATIRLDDGTDLTSTAGEEHTSYPLSSVPEENIVDGAISLNLRIVIGDPADSIEVGGIELSGTVTAPA